MMFNASCIVQGAVEFNNSAVISVVTHSADSLVSMWWRSFTGLSRELGLWAVRKLRPKCSFF